MSQSVPWIYVVDDDLSVRESVESLIRSAGLSGKTFSSAREFLASLSKELPLCLVVDLQLPDMNGFELQHELARKDIQIPTIFLTGHGDIPMSVRAIKAGALEFLTKPFEDEYLLKAIGEAIAQDDKNWRTSARIASGKSVGTSGEFIGQSRAWQQIIEQLDMVAPTDVTVLVLGETGTGKELIARELHRRSRRKDKPLVRVNCVCVPKELYESVRSGWALRGQ